MLQPTKKLYGEKLAASDGTIGHVKDFYFDDKNWVIRYLVADTGSWLSGRLVLISPHAFGKLDPEQKTFHVGLRKKQIEDSPSIDAHQPVSRQYEIEYYRYYGWPTYWDGGGMWGLGAYPVPLVPPRVDAVERRHYEHRSDKHLQSTQAVSGYQVETLEGAIGKVTGFLVDDTDWSIRDMVVEAGHWYAGREILIATANIERISYVDATVFVNLTKAEIQTRSEKSPVPEASENLRQRLAVRSPAAKTRRKGKVAEPHPAHSAR